MPLNREGWRRVNRSVKYTESVSGTGQINRRNRRRPPPEQGTVFVTCKTTDAIAVNVESDEFAIYTQDGIATGETLSGIWGWTTGGKTIAPDTECMAFSVPGWSAWMVFPDCDGLIDPVGAPLGDPPTASGSQDTGTPGELGLDATSTPASGLSITKHQWTMSLPSNETLIISGFDGSAPNFVYDSRGTWNDTDIGGDIAGNVEALTLDETGGGLSGPYTVTLTSTQTDGQTDTESIT